MLLALAFVLAPVAAPSGPTPIIGGSEVATCGWPSVVALDGTCSGTLVHPRVVLYAGHCGPNVHFVTPGEIEADGTQVAAECAVNPDWDHEAGGSDFAVCVLAEPIEDVAIVPIVMGCEHQLLAPGVPATSVGFGLAPEGPAGIKRAVTYAIDEVVLDEGDVWLGGADGSLCDGDSGGGAFVQWLDGSWRLFGVHSAVAGEPCTDGQAVVSLASGAVPWIEAHTGFDVTPCHDADGTWNPGPDCGEFPIDPATGGGAWPSCATGSLGGASSACGAPSHGPDDVAAPSIAIVSPSDGAVLPLRRSIDIAIEASDEGWGIDRTWLRIDGTDVPDSEDVFPPWEMPTIMLPEGAFTIEAVARDWAGNEGVAAVMIVVGDPPLPSESSSDEGGDAEETSDEGGGEDGNTSDAGSDDAPSSTDGSSGSDTAPVTGELADGCACDSGGGRARDTWFFAVLVVVSCSVRRAYRSARSTASWCPSSAWRRRASPFR